MPSAMPYDKARQQMISQKLREQEDSAGGRDRLPQEKLVVKGKADRCPVYRLAVDDLAFHKMNGRIKAEVLEKEAELGRKLENSSAADQAIIKQILVAIRPDENEKIREDLRKTGQLHPGIITCDGVVVNGNRRKAMLEELYQGTGEDRFKYIDVQVLPSDITKAELWLIEAGIQLSAPQQLDYSPINHLLKLREGKDSGLDVGKMAARIYGVTEERITSDLSRLALIDEYLEEFLEKPQRYYLVKQLNEHFIDLQNILAWAKRPRGNVPMNWRPDKSDISELKMVAFYYIRLRFSHLRIRELRNLFVKKESWEEVKRALEIKIQLSEEERRQLGLQSIDRPDAGEQDDDLEATQPPESDVSIRTSAEARDTEEEAYWRDANEEALKNFYEDAKEQEQILKDTQRPLALARRALRIIEAIPEDREKLSEPDVDDALRQIIERTNDLRKLIQKQRPKKGNSKKARV